MNVAFVSTLNMHKIRITEVHNRWCNGRLPPLE